jgi:pimeloyl-ACP methyl ester carboxylesterase
MSAAARTPVWRLMSSRWPLVRGALARRAQWKSRSEVGAAYARKPLFATWAEGALEDYLEDGLVESSEGVRLACDPRWEAAVYQAQGHDFWGAVARLGPGIASLVAAHRSSTVSGAGRARLKRLGVDIVLHRGAGHLLPLEAPEVAARFIVAALAVPRS